MYIPRYVFMQLIVIASKDWWKNIKAQECSIQWHWCRNCVPLTSIVTKNAIKWHGTKNSQAHGVRIQWGSAKNGRAIGWVIMGLLLDRVEWKSVQSWFELPKLFWEWGIWAALWFVGHLQTNKYAQRLGIFSLVGNIWNKNCKKDFVFYNHAYICAHMTATKATNEILSILIKVYPSHYLCKLFQFKFYNIG